VFEAMILPEVPKVKNPKKPTDHLGHMIQMCTDMIDGMKKDNDIPMARQVVLNMCLGQMRHELKMIYFELNPPKSKEKKDV
jgi:hypothetical protein